MMIEDYEQAVAAPRVPFWAQLVASLSMADLKVLPARLVPKAAEALRAISESDEIAGYGAEDEFFEAQGFTFEENHARSESHEIWQSDLGAWYEGQWVIPIDEIIAISYDDPHACDYVNIQRLFFDGTEEELEAAIDKLKPAAKKFKRPKKKVPR